MRILLIVMLSMLILACDSVQIKSNYDLSGKPSRTFKSLQASIVNTQSKASLWICNSDSFEVKIKESEKVLTVKLKGKQRFRGMRSFTLVPFKDDHLKQQASLLYAAQKNLLRPYFEMVTLSYKGETKTFVLQEKIDKRLLERNARREGLIFKSDQKNLKCINAKDFDSSYVSIGLQRIEQVLNGEMGYDYSIDRAQFAQLLAIENKLELNHKDRYYYLNPIDLKLEPILVPGKVSDKIESLEKRLLLDEKLNSIYKTSLDELNKMAAQIATDIAAWVKNMKEITFAKFDIRFLEQTNITDDYIALKPSLEASLADFEDYFVLDSRNNLKPKSTSKKVKISKPVFIPAGYQVQISPGTQLDFIIGAYLISYSSVHLFGTLDSPVRIYSSDKTCKGFLVMHAEDVSIIEHAKFEDIANWQEGIRNISASVLFYKSPVSLSNVEFRSDVSGDDMLNIVNTTFKMDNCLFEDTFSDAFDGDFVKGSITSSKFINIGNDGIDFSGSSIKANQLSFEHVEDKAISAGEASNIEINAIYVKNSAIGIASKDASVVKGNTIDMDNVEVNFTVFCKKKEYGSALINIQNFSSDNEKEMYLLEKGSQIFIDGDTLIHNNNAVKSILYGAEYGKAS